LAFDMTDTPLGIDGNRAFDRPVFDLSGLNRK